MLIWVTSNQYFQGLSNSSSTVSSLESRPSKFIDIAPKMVCTGMDHLEHEFQDILDKGGEGIILRDPAAPYASGRCPGYLKHKVQCTMIIL